MNFIFLGKQGVGKGTYAQRFSAIEEIPHISMGDLLREEIKSGSAIGKEVESIIKAGQLVSDDATAAVLGRRLQKADCKNGFILDGFPRNFNQAQTLEKELAKIGKKIDKVFNFFASEQTLMGRLSGRWQCKQCNKIYHTINIPSKVPGICDLDGAPLYQRDDDKPQAIQKRFAIYEEQTKPLIEWYKKQGLLQEINADRDIESVLKDLKIAAREKP